MQVSVEISEGLERKLNIKVESKKVEDSFEEKLNNLKRTANLKGFRPGKAPVSHLKKQYGESIRYEAIDVIMRETLPKAIEEQKLKVASIPSVDIKKDVPGEDLEYVATFEVFPEIEAIKLDGIKVEEIESDVPEEKIDEMIANLRKQLAKWNDVTDRSPQKDDKLTIDYKGFVGDEAFDGGEASNQELTLGSGSMIPGFEDGIIAAKPELEKQFSINVKFPEEYQSKDLAGKDARFDITVKKIQAPELPEINDEFVKNCGISDGNIDDLRKRINENMQTQLKSKVKQFMNQQLIDGIVKQNEIQIPKAMVQKEIEQRKKNTQDMMRSYGMKDNKAMDFPDSLFTDVATKAVKVSLLLQKYIELNDIKEDATKVREYLEEISKAYDDSAAYVQHVNSNPQELAKVKAQVFEEQVFSSILNALSADAKSNKKMTYDEVMELKIEE